MEYCDSSDLFQRISELRSREEEMEEKEIWNIFGQIVLGLRELHSRNIFHRDLKSANIFLTKNGFAKIGDMNVSKVAAKGLLHTQTGTPYYASPEVWQDKPYSNKSDIWSLGCILHEMCALDPPFQAENMGGLYKKVLRGIPEKLPSPRSKELTELLGSLLSVNPSLRPSCDDILKNPAVRKNLNEKFWLRSAENLSKDSLLRTIRMPDTLNRLKERLPKSNYQSMDTIRSDLISFPAKKSPFEPSLVSLNLSNTEIPKLENAQSDFQLISRRRKNVLESKSSQNLYSERLKSLSKEIGRRGSLKKIEQLLLLNHRDRKENSLKSNRLNPIFLEIFRQKSQEHVKSTKQRNLGRLQPIFET